MQNFHVSSIYRITLVAIVIGLVLANLLYGLFYYIGQLVNKATKNNIKPLWIINLVFVLLIVAVVFAWYFGLAEKRDARINGAESPAQIETTNEIGDDHTSLPEN